MQSLDAVPDGVVLDRQNARLEQLELLLDLDAATARGQLDAIVEDSLEGLPLECPAQAQLPTDLAVACTGGLRSTRATYF